MKYARRLAASASFRAREGLFFAEGLRLCRDLAERLPLRALFATKAAHARWPEGAALAAEAYDVSEAVAEKLAGTRSPQGLFGLFETPAADFSRLRPDDGVLVCEAMQDPANAGAVLRSAAALGLGGVVFGPGSADPFGPKALRAAMGAAGRIPVVTGMPVPEAAARLREAGLWLYAAALQNARPLQGTAPRRPFALLIGNEGAGLSAEAAAAADELVYLPMQNGVESLNAAVAAALLMYHFKGLA